MFGSVNKQHLTVSLSHDPGADDDIVLFVPQSQIEITAASITLSNALAASGTNYFNVALYNGGTAGTATTLIAGTVGGTAGYTAKTPVNFTVSNGTVTAGQVVYLGYNEEGTGTFTHAVVDIEYVIGQA